jgi:hypothetical protein
MIHRAHAQRDRFVLVAPQGSGSILRLDHRRIGSYFVVNAYRKSRRPNDHRGQIFDLPIPQNHPFSVRQAGSLPENADPAGNQPPAMTTGILDTGRLVDTDLFQPTHGWRVCKREVQQLGGPVWNTMLNVLVQAKPVAYLYLDAPGIEGLYAQTVDRIEVEHPTTVEKARSGRVGAAARLKSLFVTFLAGPEFEISGDVSGSRKTTEQSKQLQSTEQKLASLIATLKGMGEQTIFSELANAARHAGSTGTSVFINTEDEFDAPQFYSPGGASSVTRDGYLILEKDGAFDYEPGDHYYKKERLSRPLTMSASILKMPFSSKGMASTGHDARFLQGFGGRGVRLGVFGQIAATPNYFQVKPYAIWRR